MADIGGGSQLETPIAKAINAGDFPAYQLAVMHDWLRTLTLMAAVLVPLFFVLDTAMMPAALLPKFAVYRGISTALAVAQLVVVRLTLPSRWSFVHGYVISFQIGAIIALMTTDLGGFASSYYAGLNLVVMGVNLLMPWRALHTAANSLLIMVMYVLSNLAIAHQFEMTSLTNNLFFLGATMVLAAAINFVRFRLIKNEFSLLVDLRKTRDDLVVEKEIVEDRTRSLKSLLDVSGQGFLSFDQDFRILPEYSRECEAIFGRKLEGLPIDELLYSQVPAREDFKSGLGLYFEGKSKPEVIFDLLDHQLTINERIIRAEYKAVHQHQVMMVLTDITEERQLQEASRLENEKWSRLLKVIANRQAFSFFDRDAKNLFTALSNPTGGYHAIVHDLHSLKANAGFLGFVKTQAMAHEFEDFLADRIALGERIDPADQIARLSGAYQEELATVTDALGKEWHLDPETIELPRSEYLMIESHIKDYCPDQPILEALESHRQKPLSDLLNRFPAMAADLASRMGKRVAPLEIKGGDILVVADDLEELIGSFTHIIRNMVDHGIEPPGERVSLNKPPAGNLEIDITENSKELMITFSDDGRGIQLNEIKERALSLGILKADEVAAPSDLIAMIFRDDFSTAATVSEISGRGVGLPVVREAVMKIGGRIKVKTTKGQGTAITIIIPKHRTIPKEAAT